MAADRFRRSVLVSSGLALTLLLLPASASQVPSSTAPDARDFSQDIPAHLTVVTGEVTLVRDGRLEPAEANQLVLAGDRLRTKAGRAQILFNDGSTLAVDEDSLLDLLSDSLVRLIDGRLRLTISRTTEGLDYRIDHSAGFVEITKAGEYRVQVGKDRRGKAELELIVYRGSADLTNDFGRTLVRAGRHAVTSADTEPSLPYTMNSAAADDFDEWVDGLHEAHVVATTSASASYLPAEESYYASTLDTYGTWDYTESTGAVWYPQVQVGWQPYGMGRWSYTGYYGWAWVGIDYWAWPTYHYGRWGLSGAGWYWRPGHQWGPAWVAWGGSPGYVGWCPLGYDGYPVIGFAHPTPYYRDPWSAWTVMPSNSWTHNVWVSDHRMPKGGMPAGVRNGFGERPVGPAPVGGDAPRRAIAPLGGPTRPRDVATPRARTMPAATTLDGDRGVRPVSPGGTAVIQTPSRVPTATPGVRDAGSRFAATAPAVRNFGAGGSLNDRASTQQADEVPSRAVPQGVAVSSRGGNARTDATRATIPDAAAQPTWPNRAVPRGAEPPSSQPPVGADRSRTLQRAPDTSVAPPASYGRPAPAPYEPPISNRGHASERNPAPQMPSQAPRLVSPPQRGAAPSSAPPPSAPAAPPSAAPRGRSVEPSGPPPAPPSAPPARGGGAGGQGTAVSRRGGGGRG